LHMDIGYRKILHMDIGYRQILHMDINFTTDPSHLCSQFSNFNNFGRRTLKNFNKQSIDKSNDSKNMFLATLLINLDNPFAFTTTSLP
jgi:hypothetical protein